MNPQVIGATKMRGSLLKILNENTVAKFLDEIFETVPESLSKNFGKSECDFVRRRMSHMPKDEFLVLYCKFWKSLSEDMIGALLGKSLYDIMHIQQRAISRLRMDYVREFVFAKQERPVEQKRAA